MAPEQVAGDVGAIGPRTRHLQPGRDPVRAADRPAAVRGPAVAGPGPDRRGRAAAAVVPSPGPRPAAGGDLPEGDGQGGRRPLPVDGRAGRGPGRLPARGRSGLESPGPRTLVGRGHLGPETSTRRMADPTPGPRLGEPRGGAARRRMHALRTGVEGDLQRLGELDPKAVSETFVHLDDQLPPEESGPGIPHPWAVRAQSNHSSAGSNGGTTTFRMVIRPTARCRTPGGISTALPGPTATRSPSSSTAAPAAHSRT